FQRSRDESRYLLLELPEPAKEREFATRAADHIKNTPEFLAAPAGMLQELTPQYTELMQAAEARLREQAGDLSQPLLGPTLSGDPLMSPRILAIIFAAAIAGGILAIIGVLAIGALRRPRTVAEGT